MQLLGSMVEWGHDWCSCLVLWLNEDMTGVVA